MPKEDTGRSLKRRIHLIYIRHFLRRVFDFTNTLRYHMSPPTGLILNHFHRFVGYTLYISAIFCVGFSILQTPYAIICRHLRGLMFNHVSSFRRVSDHTNTLRYHMSPSMGFMFNHVSSFRRIHLIYIRHFLRRVFDFTNTLRYHMSPPTGLILNHFHRFVGYTLYISAIFCVGFSILQTPYAIICRHLRAY